MIEEHTVFSSNVSKVGYDGESAQLLVWWSKGNKVSVYEGVPPDVFDRLWKSPSVGTMIRDEIKPNFLHHYLGDDE